jgi:hypothetical protein
MLSGAAGMMWYSYWVIAKGYGAARGTGPADEKRLRGWLQQMTLDNSVAVLGTFIITAAFLVLGAELLRPRGLVPEEQRIAAVLGRLLGDLWGPVGFWFMVLAVFIGFWDTVLSDQDGHSRLFANGTRLLLGLQMSDVVLRRVFVIVLVTALPIAVYLATGNPVGLLKAAGAIEAAHIPIVTALTLYLNRTRLPAGLRPSGLTFFACVVAGGFFLVFAVLYVIQVAGF